MDPLPHIAARDARAARAARASARRRRAVVLLTGLLLASTPAAAWAGAANGGLPGAPASNPIAGLPWGNYTGGDENIGGADEVYPSYRAATGARRRLLGMIALRPRMRWFGPWDPDSQAQATAAQYVANVTGGNPGVLSQLAVFRLQPWEGESCRRLPDAGEQASYRRWIDAFARGLGSARVAMVLQPDLPFELCVPHHSPLPLELVAYAARVFSALPHTTVYIDVGASDWPSLGEATAMLRRAGVAHARGFALGATHYASTADEISFGARLAAALARAGIPGRHFVINTAQNGRGFTYQQYGSPRTFDNARACRNRGDRRCVTLGIPPTWRVADARWGLSRRNRATAARLVDGYLWIGRPWLVNQSDPFDPDRALALARSSPF